MGHEEEDKELMMIRMETLKSMIGKLKNKTNRSTCKDSNQSSSFNGNKGYRKELVDNPRTSTLTGQSSPLVSYNKGCIKSKSNPTSPSPNKSRSIVKAMSPSSASTTQLLPCHGISSMDVKPGAISTNTPTVNRSVSNITNQSLSRADSPSQITSKVSQSKVNSMPDPHVYHQTFPSSLHASKSLASSSSRPYSDSEISSRKSQFQHVESSLTNTRLSCKPVYLSNNNGLRGSCTNSSLQCAKIGLSKSATRTDKNTKLQNNNSALITQQEISNTSPTIRTITTSLTKLVKRPPTHTITKPVTNEVTKTITSTRVFTSTGPVISVSSNSSSLVSPDLLKPGKVLFERTGKILFDRHASTKQNKVLFSNSDLSVLSKGPSTLHKTPDFAQEFKLIRKKHVTSNLKIHPKATTRTKFYSSDYVPVETCEKARTILSKYKVVRKKVNCTTTKTDINANYSPPVCSPTTLPIPGKILFQRYKPSHGRGNTDSTYRGVYLKKGKACYPGRKMVGNSYRNFVSRRIKYMKSVEPNPFSMEVKPSSKGNNLHNKQAKKEIILSRHGTNYKVAGNLKSLRRLSQGQQLKEIPPARSTIYNGNYHLATSNSKLTTKNVSVKQYAASQVVKKNRLAARKKVDKDKYCLFYNRFGKCKRGEECHFIHDPEKIAICTRFLRGTCKDASCLFSHKLDPDKMPVCSYFLRGECGRDDCPYRHVNVGVSASICDDFLKGYCPRGKECVKKHILECEEFSETGTCSKGKSCILAHRQHQPSKRRYSGSRPPKGFRPKRRKVGSREEDETNEKDKNEATAHPNEGKKHMLPKFISEKIKLLRESTTEKPTSFAGIKKFYEATETDKESLRKNTNDIWGSDFIPLSNYSGGESEDESSEFIQRMFTFKK